MRNYRFLIIILILVIIGLILSPIKPVKEAVYSFFSPLARSLNKTTTSIRVFVSDLKSVKRLSNDNKTLKEENNLLKSEIASLQEIKHENEILQKELGFTQSNSSANLINARIISKSVTPFLQSFLIDKGENNQIKKEQIVMSQNHLVGTISEVYPTYSVVELITNAKTLIPVTLQSSRSTGLLKSNLEGLYIDNIPIDEPVKMGEIVITSNLDKNIPPDILIGSVSKITTYKSQIFQTVKVTSPLEFSKLEFVFVVNNEPLS